MSGMAVNPFGGHPSMNNLDDDFMESLFKGEITVDQTIALRIIKMSVRDYLYFGLGKNGITPEKFLEAYNYLFKVRAQDPRTWGDCSIQERYRNVDGVLETHKNTLQTKEVQFKCFDTHYNTSQLAEKIPISNFLARLKKKREVILNVNLKQVLSYMLEYRSQEWRTLPKRSRKGKRSFPRVGVVPILVSPDDCKELARLYLFGRTAPTEKDKTHPKLPSTLLKYKKLLF
jgi:hypothetical protein